MEIFCDPILMTYFRWRNLYDVVCDFLEVLLGHSQFLRL